MTVVHSSRPVFQRLDANEIRLIELTGAGKTRAETCRELGWRLSNWHYRAARLARKLHSPTQALTGLVYRALVSGQVQAPQLFVGRPRLAQRQLVVLHGVAQGRPLTRVAEDQQVEDWDLTPIALSMRQALGAETYPQAVWIGWQFRLITQEAPGLPTDDTRSSSQITASDHLRRPPSQRPTRPVGTSSPTSPPPAAGVPPRSRPGAA
ncbi:hypothetical protein [Streptomyces sp. MJM1172]|uniref:hypothetical protein n=1 Tax=Streptomyces sp. MJM1172 TaxID=1703926 RepID=UPI00093A6DDE|nr:hypothetical protein [Streptomyces sp. MJM1172]OKI50348.1 hypothetical protein AMK15_32880 [Streptomyces sp. MJM1172]